MDKTLRTAALLLGLFFAASSVSAAHRSVRDFGAKGDGHTLDTAAVNAAIADAAKHGGGTVFFPVGDYLCHSIRLQSNITLQLSPGSTIIAADPPPVGPGSESAPGYDPAEPNPWHHYQDFGHSHWHNSLIWGENLENVSIIGPGRIYGRGLSRGNGRKSLGVGATPPHTPGIPLATAIGADGPSAYVSQPHLVPGPFNYPNERDSLPDGVGNKAIALKNCRGVILRDFSVLHGGHFAILATGVDNLTIDNLIIDTNRDGIDIDACKNVRISNCSVNSPWDDGICLKSSHGLGEARITENVTITNCVVSGYDEGTLLDRTRQRKLIRRHGPIGRIKLGTEAGGGFRNIVISNCVFEYCRGLALEQVDGGVMEDIVISNITMRDVLTSPLFIRLASRLRRPETTEPGTTRRIIVDNLIAYNVAPESGILIAGVPGYPIEDVVLSNIQIHYAGGGTAEQATREVPEFEQAYPDPTNFGILPSWALFARHVKNLQVRGAEFRALSPDARPAILLDDVDGARFADTVVRTAQDLPVWSLKEVRSLHARDVTRLPDGDQPDATTVVRR